MGKLLFIILGVFVIVFIIILAVATYYLKNTSTIYAPECEQLSNNYKEACYQQAIIEEAIEKNDSSMCEESKFKDACYSEFAIKKLDQSVCEKIQDKTMKEVSETSLHDNCFKSIAIAKNDSSICDSVLNKDNRFICYTIIAEATLNSTICDKVNEQGFYRKQCYVLVAIKAEDPTICDSLDTVAKTQCRDRLSESVGDISYCHTLEDSNIVAKKEYVPPTGSRTLGPTEECYANAVRAEKDPAICLAIISDYLRLDCFKDLAFITENPLVCDNIEETDKKRDCYHDATISLILNREVG